MIRLCFVCLGNICRSPTAEGIMLDLVRREQLTHEFVIDSAGTTAAHDGEQPDRRATATARARGVELPSRARRFVPEDFARFDLILAMDRDNRAHLLSMAPDEIARGKVVLLRSFDPAAEPDSDVPDPYYGGPEGFERVFELCEAACNGLLTSLRRERRL